MRRLHVLACLIVLFLQYASYAEAQTQDIGLLWEPQATVFGGPGSQSGLRLTPQNLSSTVASGVTVTIPIPTGTIFRSGISTGAWSGCPDGATAPAMCTATIEDFSSGFALSVFLGLEIDAAAPCRDSFIFTAVASGALPDPVPDNNLVVGMVDTGSTCPPQDLGVVSAGDQGKFSGPGSVGGVRVTPVNNGPGVAGGAALVVPVPDGTIFRSGPTLGAFFGCADGDVAPAVCTFVLPDFGVGLGQSVFMGLEIDALTACSKDFDFGASIVGSVPDPVSANNSLVVNISTGSDCSPASRDLGIVSPLDTGKFGGPGSIGGIRMTGENLSSGVASGATIGLAIPPGTIFRSAQSKGNWTVCADGATSGVCVAQLPDFGSGFSESVFLALEIDSSAPCFETFNFSAEILGIEPDPVPGNNVVAGPISSGSTCPGAGTDVTIVGLKAFSFGGAGSSGAVRITPRNLSQATTATNVTVFANVPPGASFHAPASVGDWNCASGVCSVTTDTSLAAGALGTSVQFGVRLDDPLVPCETDITFRPSVGANEPDPFPANNDITVTLPTGETCGPPGVDLALELVVDEVPGGPGEIASWRASPRVIGAGPSTGVRLFATVPDGTVFDAAASVGTFDCSDQAPAGTGCFASVPDIPGNSIGESVLWGFRLIEDACVESVTLDMNAKGVEGDPAPGNNSETSTQPTGVVCSPTVDLRMNVFGSTAGQGVGSVAEASFTVLNGAGQAKDVEVVATVPHGTQFAGGADGSFLCDEGGGPGDRCTMFLGTLAPNLLTAPFAFEVEILEPGTSPCSEEIRFDAVVSRPGGGPDPTPANNSASIVVASGLDCGVSGVADLALEAEGPEAVRPGEAIRFEVTSSHLGTSATPTMVRLDFGGVDLEVVPENSSVGWVCMDGGCEIELGTMFPADVAIVILVVRAPEVSGLVTTVAEVLSQEGLPDPVMGNNSRVVETDVQIGAGGPPSVVDIPTLGELGGLALLVLLAIAGVAVIRRRPVV